MTAAEPSANALPGRGHALLAPSKAHQWMPCPGSLTLEEGLPDGESEFSAEGTGAHELAKWTLTEGQPAAAYVGRIAHVQRRPMHPDGDREWEVTDEMAAYVQDYADRVRQYAGDHPLLVEQRLPIGHVTGEEGAAGTGDAVILADDELIVCDLKYGRGVRVEAERNPQEMLYALGALREFEVLIPGVKRVRLVILQPRLEHVSEWDCSVEELLAFGRQAADAAELTRLASKFRAKWAGQADTPYLVPGDKQCVFCRAKPTCPALAAHVSRTVGAQFADLTAAAPKDQVKRLVPAALKQLGAAQAAVDLVEDWCRAVRAEVERVLVAGANAPELIEELGQKLVQGKRGSRAWSDESAAEKMLRERFRLKVEEAYSMKLISPTQAEKLLKDQPKRWAALQELVTQSEGRPSVAPAGDRRPAMSMTPTADDFEDLSAAQGLT